MLKLRRHSNSEKKPLVRDTVLQLFVQQGFGRKAKEMLYDSTINQKLQNEVDGVSDPQRLPHPPPNTSNGTNTTTKRKSHAIITAAAASRPVKSSLKRLCGMDPESCSLVKELESAEERKRFADCLGEANDYIQQHKALVPDSHMAFTKCTCRLKTSNRTVHHRVALVSLPGSGNTWVRGLLEQATGVCTAAMWCDPNLRATHFCGEGLHSSRTLVVKNHDPAIRWRGEALSGSHQHTENNKPEFDLAIFVHRNPFEAMVAEHNREVGFAKWEDAIKTNRTFDLPVSHHVQSYGAEYFGDNVQWNARIKELTQRWKTMVIHLLVRSRQRPVLLVKYEDLVENPSREVARMVRFLGYGGSLSEDGVGARHQRFDTFKRNHTVITKFEQFTAAQKKFINTAIYNVGTRLSLKVLPVQEYIRN